jgi:hypothetical protein
VKGCFSIKARNHERWSNYDRDFFRGSVNGVKGCTVLTDACL